MVEVVSAEAEPADFDAVFDDGGVPADDSDEPGAADGAAAFFGGGHGGEGTGWFGGDSRGEASPPNPRPVLQLIVAVSGVISKESRILDTHRDQKKKPRPFWGAGLRWCAVQAAV